MRIEVRFLRCSLLILPLGIVCSHGGSLYVSTQGSDASPGTSGQPFRTITRAYSAAHPGDTVVVMPGVYSDYTSGWGIHLGANGTASSPITLRSQVRGAAVIDGLNASDRNVGFYIDGTYNIVDGFEIRNAPKGGITIWANDNEILNCNIHNNGNPVDSSTDGRDGIYSNEGTSGNVYAANYIHHNGRTGSNLDHGLYLCGQNEQVINNILFANSACGLQIAGYTTVGNMKVYNNVMAFNGTDGIILWQSLNGIDIKNNIFYRNGHYAIGSYDAHGSNVVVDRNLSFANGYGSFDFADGGSDYSYTLGTAIYLDPQFADGTVTSFDPHLSIGSPCAQAGLNLSAFFTTDLNGAPRSASGAWDLGAYVYTGLVGTSPVISLISPANGATYSEPATISLAAIVVPNGHTISSVQFFNGATLLATVASSPFNFTWSDVRRGSYTLSAQAVYDAGTTVSSAGVNVLVTGSPHGRIRVK